LPTYSYRCTSCEHAFDIHQAFTDDNLSICPNCGGALRKVFSPIGVSFTGSGFYRNDSRSENKTTDAPGRKAASGDASSSSSTESASTPSAPTAPAAASAPAAPSAPKPATPSAPAA
jgi:putative FmdB family regulatory protein